jgi:hypothetical protein
MILSVTVLGSTDGRPLAVIGQRIVEYLEGGRAIVDGLRPGTLVELPSPEGGTVAYYAYSTGLRWGRWVLRRSREADPAELSILLDGRRRGDRGAAHLGAGIGKAGRTDTSSRAPAHAFRQHEVVDEGSRLGPRVHPLLPPLSASGQGPRQ